MILKIWTYGEMNTKLQTEQDLLDETFITPNEMIGYYNEALNEAESKIMVLNQDYFKTKYFVPTVLGTVRYVLPDNIYANKIRTMVYQNGALTYEIPQYRRRDKFLNVAYSDQYTTSDEYQYQLVNDIPGQAILEIHPASRETAILPPSTSAFTPVTMHYIRNCARVPIVGEYCNPEVVATSQVDATANTIAVNSGSSTTGIVSQGVVGCFPGSIAYITGDQVKFKAGPGGSIPGGLTEGTVYYVIAVSSTSIKLATSLVNALAGTAIDITSQGSVFFTIQVAATTAIINACLIDIPEFSSYVMQYVRCRCLNKEGDPRIQSESQILEGLEKSMVDTLTRGIDDDADEIENDFTHYQEMS